MEKLLAALPVFHCAKRYVSAKRNRKSDYKYGGVFKLHVYRIMAKYIYSFLSILLAVGGFFAVWLVWIGGNHNFEKYGKLAKVSHDVGVQSLLLMSILSFVFSFLFLIINPVKKSISRVVSKVLFGVFVTPLFLFLLILAARLLHNND